MRIAIPVYGNRISPVLDVAQEIKLFDLERGQILNEITITLDSESLLERAEKLKETGVEEVICGAVSQFFYQIIVNQKIEVLPWLTGSIHDILKAFFSGQLTQACFRMPGCRAQTSRGRYRTRRGSPQMQINEEKSMRVAVTADGTTIEANVDPRFGRAKYFLLINPTTNDILVHDNQANQQAAGGAGIQAAEAIAKNGTGVLLTGHCGPKAFRALDAVGIKVVLGVEGTVRSVLDSYKKGEYSFTNTADVESHW